MTTQKRRMSFILLVGIIGLSLVGCGSVQKVLQKEMT